MWDFPAGWLDLSSFQHPVLRSVYAAVLKKGDPSPVEPQSDEEKAADEKKDAAGGDKGKEAGKNKEGEKSKEADKAKEGEKGKEGEKKRSPSRSPSIWTASDRESSPADQVRQLCEPGYRQGRDTVPLRDRGCAAIRSTAR